ncbi:MAG: aminomethyl-transferring glycine dehydrogenase subunit GcvPA [Thermodesulfobacteriota bacterium]
MDYTSLANRDIKEMLEVIGVSSVDELFSQVPESFKLGKPLELPWLRSEEEVTARMAELSGKNSGTHTHVSFLGAGAYEHITPAVMKHLLGRSEFYTSYTPYQPELAQGTLQGMFEFQTMVCEITALEVANASMYDGSTATAEAALMASRITGQKKILVSSLLHPEYRRVLKTCLLQNEIVEIPLTGRGLTDMDFLAESVDEGVAAVVVQNPNFFGAIEDLDLVSRVVSGQKALFIVVTSEPFCYGILKSPGQVGADIAVGEFQPFGLALNYGGPYAGYFASRKEYLRQMPGRIVGETVDGKGNRGFVVTIATREQHIRRERATSNICTSQSLCALGTVVFLSLIGKEGFREISLQNLSKTEYAKSRLREVVEVPFDCPTFNEFVYRCSNSGVVLKKLIEAGYLGGAPLEGYYPELKGHILFTVTERRTKEEIDGFIEALKGALN